MPRFQSLLGIALLVSACGDAPELQRSACDGATNCRENAHCPTGSVCGADGCCEPAADSAHQADWLSTCNTASGGCQCRVRHQGGGLSETATWLMPPGSTQNIQAVLETAEGRYISASGFSLSLAPGASFRLEGHALRATETPGEARIDVSFGDIASCAIKARNVGAPQPGNLRIWSFNAETGTPLRQARVVVRGPGDDWERSATTDASGLAAVPLDAAASVSITVFAEDHVPTTVAGLKPEGLRQLAIPVRPHRRATTPVRGTLDFAPYERMVLQGEPADLRLAMVSSGLELESFLDFNMDLLLGAPQNGKTCVPGSQQPGCYAFDLPGLKPRTGPARGGLVANLPGAGTPSGFAVNLPPGEHAIWGFGGEYTLSESHDMLELLVNQGLETCACDDAGGSCNAGCQCDPDCQGLDVGRFFREVLPLLAKAAHAVETGVLAPMLPPGATNERAMDEHLRLVSPVDGFLRVALPQLPPDPARPEVRMEGVVALTGVELPQAGFIPLGLGAGFDCQGTSCRGAASADAHRYDGQINATDPCAKLAQPLGFCAFGAAPVTQGGQLGVLYASDADLPAHATRLTAILAMPVDSQDAGPARTVGWLVRHDTHATGLDVSQVPLPEVGEKPRGMKGRTFAFGSSHHADLHAVTLEGHDGRRWQVYAPAGTKQVVLPQPENAAAAINNTNLASVTHGLLGLAHASEVKTLLDNGALAKRRLLTQVTRFVSERWSSPRPDTRPEPR